MTDLPTVLRTISRISKLGIDLIDLSVRSEAHLGLLSASENARQIREQCIKHRISIERLDCYFMYEWIFGDVPKTQIEEQWSKIARLAEIVGAKTIDMVSPPVTVVPTGGDDYDPVGEVDRFFLERPWADLWKIYISAIGNYCRIANGYGLRLAIEPRPREFVGSTESMLRVMDEVQEENLGCTVDVGHSLNVRESPQLAIRKLGNKLFGVHLSDTDGLTNWHWAPGSGIVDWPPIFAALLDIGYDDELSLDVLGMDIEEEALEGKAFVDSFLRSLGAR